MPGLKITGFGGMIPLQDPFLLPETFSTLSRNTNLYSGALEGFKYPQLLRALTSSTANMVYRIPDDRDQTGIEDASTWLEFDDPHTDVIRTQVSNDSFARYYWTSPTSPPRYNTTARIVAGDPSFILGVPTPVAAPTVAIVAGLGLPEVRAYVYTWVTAYGEESAPSPPTVVTATVAATWELDVTAPTAADTTDRNLTRVRIYRSLTSTSGNTAFYRLVEMDIGLTHYSDLIAANDLVQGEILDSFAYTAPPALEGWVNMPNGIIAGWTGQDLWFSEPYRPHAWPAAYSISVEFPIVGLGVVGGSLVVATTGTPVLVSGTRPEAMSSVKFQASEPCISRRSVVSTPEGVYYASPTGLVQAVPGSLGVVTKALLSKQTWVGAYAPEGTSSSTGLHGVKYRSGYLGYICDTDRTGGFLIDAQDARVAFNEIMTLATGNYMKNILIDEWSGEVLFVGSDNNVYLWDPPVEPGMLPYIWTSKKFQFAFQDNMAAGRFFFDDYVAPSALVPFIESGLVDLFVGGEPITLYVYADDNLVMTKQIFDNKPFRLPSGFKADWYQYKIVARVRIQNFQVATSMRELRAL